MILCVIISCVKSDICDFCICTKSDCEPAIDNSTKECFDQIDEFFNCNANDQTFKMSQQTFDINSIQWPHRNTTVSARFNNFKLTYLTKYFLFTLCLFFLHYQESDFIVINARSFFFSVLCSALTPGLSPTFPTLLEINLDSNSIEHIVNDPFQFCANLASVSMANNLIGHLPSGIRSAKNVFLYGNSNVYV